MGNMYLVQQWCEEKSHWEISGVFDTQDKAILACRDNNYCILKMVLNEQFPHESVDGDYFFPFQQEENKQLNQRKNIMSEWITDRRPTVADCIPVYTLVYNANGDIVDISVIREGEPWMPIIRPDPYAKTKRWRVVDSQKIGFAVYDGTKVMKVVAINLPTREAAERIAAIYEEVMT